METVTHLLSGALVARAIAPALLTKTAERKTAVSMKAAILCGATAAVFPDIDFVAAAFGQLSYLMNHRGITHSLLLLPLWALLVSALFALLARQRQNWLVFYPYAFAGLVIHVLGDLITTYGTMILSPFSDARFEWGTTFIVDLWLSGIIIVGLLASWRWRNSRIPALATIVVMVGYIGFQAVLKERAIDAGQAYARANGLQETSVNTLPQAFSPFRWMVIVKSEEVYWYAYLNLLHDEKAKPTAPTSGWIARLNAAYSSVDHAVWQPVSQFGSKSQEALTRAAYEKPSFAFYRWFAAYPVLSEIEHSPSGDCVWFEDLRFKIPGFDHPSFRYGMCQTGNTWQPMRWKGLGIRKAIS